MLDGRARLPPHKHAVQAILRLLPPPSPRPPDGTQEPAPGETLAEHTPSLPAPHAQARYLARLQPARERQHPENRARPESPVDQVPVLPVLVPSFLLLRQCEGDHIVTERSS